MRTSTPPFPGRLRPGQRDPQHAALARLRTHWSRRATTSRWPTPEADWYCPAVDAVCRALLDPNNSVPELHQASRRLGESRAETGARLEETRNDLDIVLGLTRVTYTRRLQLRDALTLGWAERTITRLSTPQLLDPRNEMPTLDYLALRLRELYSKATRTGERVADHYVLIVVETEHTTQPLAAETRLTALYSALLYAFDYGESIVAVPPRRALALAATDEPQLSDSLATLRSELEIAIAERRLPKTRCWSQPLPRDPVELSLTLLGMAD